MPKKDVAGLQKRLYQQIMSSGEQSISITQIDGITALRLLVVSPHTTYDDLFKTMDRLRELR